MFIFGSISHTNQYYIFYVMRHLYLCIIYVHVVLIFLYICFYFIFIVYIENKPIIHLH